ncbi:hypothetical protein CAEBREN_10600 [Caenorhabditis brenneri]|uniref:Uncharacterized protein n=1 Tax=Caenorhabditis brenneri TaxID=135651 RepID=G0PJ44_CAEBE|nr:hypothetical protein CAEBREN_10600 [Caenorhabditis brenneri]
MIKESEIQNVEAAVPADDAVTPTEKLLDFCDKNLSKEELCELFAVLLDNFCSPQDRADGFLDVLKLIFENFSRNQNTPEEFFEKMIRGTNISP